MCTIHGDFRRGLTGTGISRHEGRQPLPIPVKYVIAKKNQESLPFLPPIPLSRNTNTHTISYSVALPTKDVRSATLKQASALSPRRPSVAYRPENSQSSLLVSLLLTTPFPLNPPPPSVPLRRKELPTTASYGATTKSRRNDSRGEG